MRDSRKFSPLSESGAMRSGPCILASTLLLLSIAFPVRVDRLLGSVVQGDGTTDAMYHVVAAYGVFTCLGEGLFQKEVLARGPAGLHAVTSAVLAVVVATSLAILSVARVKQLWFRLVVGVWCAVYLALYLWGDVGSLLALVTSYRTPFTYLCTVGTVCRVSVLLCLVGAIMGQRGRRGVGGRRGQVFTFHGASGSSLHISQAGR